MLVALKTLCLIVLLSPAQAIGESLGSPSKTTTNVFDSMHFIVLPYLNTFHFNHNNQPCILRHDKNQFDLSAYQWVISTITMPEFSSQHGSLNILDDNPHANYRLTANRKNIIIPIQTASTLTLPLRQHDTGSSPLWLRYSKTARTTWHTPSLTPIVKARIIAARKRETQQAERLAKHMADRAFYFGYDTNDDALK